MKYIILLSVLFTSIAFAGNPDQDLIVDMARERFAASREAKMDDVKIGKVYKCVIYSAQRGIMPDYNKLKEIFQFEKDGESKLVNKKDFIFGIFELTPEGFVSTVGDKKLYMRVAKNSALVFENVGPQPKRHKAYRSIADKKLRGLDYIYCR